MITWMLYLTAVSAAMVGAALAAESALRRLRLPARGVWLVAMVGSIVLPLLLPRLRQTGGSAGGAESGVFVGEPLTAVGIPILEPVVVVGGIIPRAPGLDPLLLGGWFFAGLALLGFLLIGGIRLNLRSRDWRPARVDRTPVLVSSDTGPAVIGFDGSRIVLPEWALSLPARSRSLLVRHEREHQWGGDVQLLYAGLAVLVLCPWNPCLWYALRRLRLAIEVDCDARVLRLRPDLASYGSLLLTVGSRTRRSAAFAMPAAVEGRSALERRIRIMTAPRARRAGIAALPLGVLAVGLFLVACEMREPARGPMALDPQNVAPRTTPLYGVNIATSRLSTNAGAQPTGTLPPTPSATDAVVAAGLRADTIPEPDRDRRPADRDEQPAFTPRPVDIAEQPVFTPRTRDPRLSPEQRRVLIEYLDRNYPDSLRAEGIGGRTVLWVFIDSDGRVRNTRVVESSGYPKFDELAQQALRAVTFEPARNREETVPVWVQLPIVFSPERADPPEEQRPSALADQVFEELNRELEESVRRLFTRAVSQPQETRALPRPEQVPAPGPLDQPTLTPVSREPRLSMEQRQALTRYLERNYPAELRNRGVSSRVVLWAFVDEGGMVRNTRIVESAGNAFDDVVMRALREVTFDPARNRDEAVPVWIQLPIAFNTM